MVRQYDGYHFHPSREGVFNPFSALSALRKREFGDYWFQTGTPTFLVELLKKSEFDLRILIDGVETTQVGYANGNIANPTYKQVCSGATDFAETVKVQYDPVKVDLAFLIDLYFKTIDPTSVNKQGNDRGTQYRTGIYYTDPEDLSVIQETVHRLAATYTRPLAVEIKPLENFYPAEEYHQDYLDKNVDGYCHINPKLFELARKANA